MSSRARRLSWIIVLVVGAALVQLGVWLGRGSFEHLILGFLLPLYAIAVLVPIVAICLGWTWLARRRGLPSVRADWMVATCSQACLLLASLMLSYALGRPLAVRDFEDAQQFCEQAMPKLDAFRAARGNYPRGIEAILVDGERLPRLFDCGNAAYRGSDQGCGFWVRSTDSYRHFGFGFDSVHRTWVELEEPYARSPR